MILEHRNKKVGWYRIGDVVVPTASNIHERVRRISEESLERAHGHGMPYHHRRK